MIENGMIVGQEWYDKQYQKLETEYCFMCHEYVPDYETTEFWNGEIVCKDCFADYLKNEDNGLAY